MKCGDKEWQHCQVEKMGCTGCHYDKKDIEEVIKGLESLIDDRLSFLAPDDYNDEDNIFLKDVKVLREAIQIIKGKGAKNMNEIYKLCYVEGNKAWFTNNFEKQWGDDWNDKPYEDNAGYPYDEWSELIEDNEDIFKRKYKHHPIKHKILYFEIDDWSDKRPCDVGSYSVEDINKQAIAWVHTDKFNILAGTTYENFIDIIEKHNGKIYLPKEEK